MRTPEKVERRGGYDRLGGPQPYLLLPGKPVLGKDAEGVPLGCVPEKLEANFGLFVPRGPQEPYRQFPKTVLEEELRLPVDLLVQVVGPEGARPTRAF
jgi:hypothetical protein